MSEKIEQLYEGIGPANFPHPIWRGYATDAAHAKRKAKKATGRLSIGKARRVKTYELVKNPSMRRKNGKYSKGVVDITHVEGVEYRARCGNHVFTVAIPRHVDGGLK